MHGEYIAYSTIYRGVLLLHIWGGLLITNYIIHKGGMYIRVVLGDASLRLTLGLESTCLPCGSAFAITCQAFPYWLGLSYPFIRWVAYLNFLLKELRDP